MEEIYISSVSNNVYSLDMKRQSVIQLINVRILKLWLESSSNSQSCIDIETSTQRINYNPEKEMYSLVNSGYD